MRISTKKARTGRTERPPCTLAPTKRLLQLGSLWLVFIGVTLCTGSANAHTGTIPPSLKDLKVPPVPGLLDGKRPIVVDKEKAIVLGKALFWDMAVGSDGIACASCHFHAGADHRTKNQFGASQAYVPAAATARSAFDRNDRRGKNLSNYQLKSDDFPLHDPARGELDPDTATHNVVASSGTFSGTFVGVSPTGPMHDDCRPYTGDHLDRTFHVGAIHTRRVEPRNAPTVINAVLFDRNFWDGRANFYFNGLSNWGRRDTRARIWINDEKGLRKARIALPNSSIASLATGPALSEFEMSCKGRTWPDIGRKLLKRRALTGQKVHRADSVLGPHRHTRGEGLKDTYESLIQQAFAPRFWSAGTGEPFGKPRYSPENFSQAEANFSFFFGIAIQLYSATLISDDTRFDQANIRLMPDGRFIDRNGILNRTEMEGLRLFNEAHCIFCHSGPLLSSATTRATYRTNGKTSVRTMVKREKTGDLRYRMIDEGYLNNGAAPSEHDPGLAARDLFGHPLAFATQYLGKLAGHPNDVVEPLPRIKACEIGFNTQMALDFFTEEGFGAGNLIPDPAGSRGCVNPQYAAVPKPDVVAAALANPSDTKLGPVGHRFKVPQLYNIELTGPYMHNGGMSNLEQVVDHYMRGGNFQYFQGKGNPEIDQFFMFALGASDAERQALIAFLKTLTDERVRYERAPFDHPQLFVPHGHPGDSRQTQASSTDPLLAEDTLLEIPAVGKRGRSQPLQSFQQALDAAP